MGSSIVTLKEQRPISYAPLILAEFVFADGSTLNVSTAPLNVAEGGFQFGGQDYFARIDDCKMGAIQERPPDGITRVPSASIYLHDSDKLIWTNYEYGGPGFTGAKVTLRFIFWQADTSNFSSDSYTPFVGICDPARMVQKGRAELLVVNAVAMRNSARTFLPEMHFQSLCSNIFPATAAQRLAGGTDRSSPWFGCGYDPDQTGTDPEIGGDCKRGNLNSGVPFTTCNLTRQDCETRGMFNVDSSARNTKRFTGIEWAPLNRMSMSESYLSGKWIPVLNSRNDAIFNQRVPKVRGTQWITPGVANLIGDANSTRNELVVCLGQVGPNGILQVVLNGVILPPAASSPDQKLFRWSWISYGLRSGGINPDAGYDSKSDPYGSQSAIEVVYYSQLGDSSSVPTVQVLTQGPAVKIPNTANPSDQPTWPFQYTTNPVWNLLDEMVDAGWSYSDLDLQSFINEASWCNTSVTYTTLTGGSSSHARYKCQYGLSQQRSAGEVFAAILRSFNAQLYLNPISGKISILIRKGLADQQSSPVTGSNYNAGITSTKADGTSGTGYVAFDFNESNIGRPGMDEVPFLETWADPLAQTPNELLITFQDEDNSYAEDSIKIVEPDAVARAGGYLGGQEIPEQFIAMGFSNFDQCFRVGQTYLAERLRGNPTGDTRGTRYWRLPLNFRISAANLGAICRFSWQAHGVSNQLVRIVAIQPGLNYETCDVVVAWHNDLWYTDAYGQQAQTLNQNPSGAQQPNRPPYPWQPYAVQPISGDSLWWSPAGYAAGSRWSFGVAQGYGLQENGNPIAEVAAYGCPPVTQLSPAGSGTRPPLMGVQGTTATVGGTISGGITVYLAIAAIDSNGLLTPLSKISTVAVPAGTNTNTVTTPTIFWQSGTVGYVLFAGTDSQNLAEQARNNASTPGTITLTSLNLETYGPPDSLASKMNFRAKRIIHSGTWGDACTAVSSNGDGTGFITFAPPTNHTTNAYAGYDIQLVANPLGDTTQVPWATFHIIGNTGTTFHVSPDPNSIVTVGSVFIPLFKMTAVTSNTITDSNFSNPYGSGMNAGDEIGLQLIVYSGTGGPWRIYNVTANTSNTWTIDGTWIDTPDSTTRWMVVVSQWEYDNDTQILATATANPSPAPQVATLNVENWRQTTLLIQANIKDANDNASMEPFAPWRPLFIWGAQGSRLVTS